MAIHVPETTLVDQTVRPVTPTPEYPNYDLAQAGGMIVYASANAGFMFADEAGTVKIKKADALKMFLCHKLVVKFNSNYYIPTQYADGTVTCGSNTFKAE